jgi:hypothetical protein
VRRRGLVEGQDVGILDLREVLESVPRCEQALDARVGQLDEHDSRKVGLSNTRAPRCPVLEVQQLFIRKTDQFREAQAMRLSDARDRREVGAGEGRNAPIRSGPRPDSVDELHRKPLLELRADPLRQVPLWQRPSWKQPVFLTTKHGRSCVRNTADEEYRPN